MNDLRYIKDLLVKYKFKYILGIVSLLAVDLLQLLLPKIFGILTDLLKSGMLKRSDLLKYALYIVLIAIGIAVFRFFWRYLVFGVSKILETLLRDRFYEHLQRLSANYYNNHKTGDLMAHATNDINNIRIALGQGMAMAVDSLLIPVVAAVMMFMTAGWKLTLASFIPLVALAFVMGIGVKLINSRVQKMQEAFSLLTEKVRENFSGIRVIKSFAQENSEINNFEGVNRNNREMNLRFVMVMSLLFPTVMSVSAISFAIALWYGGILVIRQEITLGAFVAFNSYLMMLVWPIAALGWIASMLERGFVSLRRINAIMDEKSDIIDSSESENIKNIMGDIEIRNLTFKYPGTDRMVLKNINVRVEKGKTLALVGRTGSGKTTLAGLIVRLYNVDPETLFIDGNDINHIPVSLLRSHIGYVPQDTFLFSTTVKDNIDFFKGACEEEIEKSAKISMVYNDIKDFPQKFDTLVGERGVTLSGGQKQRIAIARAVLRSPAILILDDCLSAVDTNTEEEILKGLREIMKQRTSIIISHRISTVKDADEIIVLDEGEIVERGNHEELLGLKGNYYELYQKQLLAEQLEGEE